MLKYRLKQALCTLITLMLVLGNSPAEASQLTDALNSLLGGNTGALSVNNGGYYSSEARGAFIGGGMDVRFPQRSTPSIVNVVPFQFNAGCGGISLAFGGFSFINGTEIESLIRSVAQDAIGMAVELVMTTLCGPCASVMQVMRQLSMEAANRSISSCAIAAKLVDKAGAEVGSWHGGLPSEFNTAAQSICGLFSSVNGLLSDYTNGSTSPGCSNTSQSVSKISSWVDDLSKTLGVTPGNKAQALCSLGGPCNMMWHVFNATTSLGADTPSNNRIKLVLMNLTGTNVVEEGSTGSAPASSTGTSSTASSATSTTNSASNGSIITAAEAINPTYKIKPGSHTFAPTMGNIHTGGLVSGIDIQKVYQLFLCGTTEPTGLTAEAMAVYDWACSQAPSEGNISAAVSFGLTPVWDCGSAPSGTSGSTGTSDPYANCDYPYATTLASSKMAGTGFLPTVANLLSQGVQAVIQGQSLPQPLINLMNNVPVPIYQAINIAAVYPDAGADLIQVMSVEVADLLTYSYIQQISQEAANIDNPTDLPATQMSRIYRLLGALHAGTIQDEHTIMMQMTLQQEMMNQIRMLNVAMQRQVLTPQLLTENAYSSQLSNSVSSATQ